MMRKLMVVLILCGALFAQKAGRPPVTPLVEYSAPVAPVSIVQLTAWATSMSPLPSGDTTVLGLTAKVQHTATEPDRYMLTLCQGPMTPCVQPFIYEIRAGNWIDQNGIPHEEFHVTRILRVAELTPKAVIQ